MIEWSNFMNWISDTQDIETNFCCWVHNSTENCNLLFTFNVENMLLSQVL